MTDAQKIIIDQAKRNGDTETVELLETMNKYEDTFGNDFPTAEFTWAETKKIIEIMNDCISKGKDVHELSYTVKYDLDIYT